MCGITGIIGYEKCVREEMVRKMNASLFHRGPDESGWFSDDYGTLAMRRLAIIDLNSGSQPLHNKARNVLVFFNGEIYNYRELRAQLIEKRYSFRTQSDTEVIVNLYDEYGEQMLGLLKGMFVFCIYDKTKGKYFFARDRFGEKPLFYYYRNSTLVFSSEVKSLLCCSLVPRVLNKKYLQYYLTASYVPEPFTLFEDVYTIPPGFQMTFIQGEIHLKQYFKIQYREDSSIKTIDEAVEIIKPKFKQAVQRQMISDVPLGAFLSGGIDSSSVVAVMQGFSSKPIKTFNVKFEDATYDESSIAREVANHLGTDHHQIIVPNAEFDEEIFWKIIDHVGLPFPDSSAIPTYYITKEIKKHVTVALSGDGGDELFAGYSLFNWFLKIQSLKNIPLSIRRKGNSILDGITSLPLFNQSSTLRKVNKAIRLSTLSEDKIPAKLHSMFEETELANFKGINSGELSLLASYSKDYMKWDDLRKIMFYRIKHNLPLDMLTKLDRMSMANSLEVRAPFLDVDLFEASSILPRKLLIRGNTGKIIIRSMIKHELPECVFKHPKTGFSIPLHKYQNKDFTRLVEELFFEKKILGPLVPSKYLKEITFRGINNPKSNAKQSIYNTTHQLWSLLQLAGWIKRFDVDINA